MSDPLDLRTVAPPEGVALPRMVVPRVRETVRALPLRAPTALPATVTLALHLLFLSRALGSDEGGFAMVARFADRPGPYLYGPQWVDRPPGLIGVFAVADRLGPYGPRITAAVIATALVVTLSLLARTVAGPVACRWTAWAACALSSTVMFEGQALNGELIAALAVSIAMAGAMLAPRPRQRRSAILLAVLAGAGAASAVMVKQNFVDAVAFTAVLWVLSLRRGLSCSRFALLLAGWAAGAAVPVGAAIAWSQGRGGIGALGYAMFGFRLDATKVMTSWSVATSQHRAAQLAYLALGSGLILLVLVVAVRNAHRLRRLDPLPWALVAAFTVEVAGIMAGESYWSHYLLGVLPTVALGVGLTARHREVLATATRRLTLTALAVTVLVDLGVAGTAHAAPSSDTSVADWLHASAHAGDTIAVPFTHANVIDMSGLVPGYPYSWSLPVRTLDPRLTLLRSTLAGAHAPTWVVRWDPPHSWGLDPHNRIEKVLRRHYREVATACGHPVWLHDGVRRQLAPALTEKECHGVA